MSALYGYLNSNMKLARIDFSGEIKGSAFLVQNYQETPVNNHTKIFEHAHGLNIDRTAGRLRVGSTDQAKRYDQMPTMTTAPVCKAVDRSWFQTQLAAAPDKDKPASYFPAYPYNTTIRSYVYDQVSTNAWQLNRFDTSDTFLRRYTTWGDTPQVLQGMCSAIASRYGLTLNEARYPVAGPANDDYLPDHMPGSLVYIPSAGFGFWVLDDVPARFASLDTFLVWRNSVSVEEFRGWTQFKGDDLVSDGSSAFSPYKRNSLGETGEIWYPLNGPFTLVSDMYGTITRSLEVMSSWPGQPELVVFKMNVTSLIGRLGLADIVSYYTNAFGLQVQSKPVAERDLTYWNVNASADFLIGPLMFDLSTLDYDKIDIANKYNRAREKACKSKNFLDTEFSPGVTWRTVQNTARAAPRKNLWITETSSSGNPDWTNAIVALKLTAVNTCTLTQVADPDETLHDVLTINGTLVFKWPAVWWTGSFTVGSETGTTIMNKFDEILMTYKFNNLSHIDLIDEYMKNVVAVSMIDEETGAQADLDFKVMLEEQTQMVTDAVAAAQAGFAETGLLRMARGSLYNSMHTMNSNLRHLLVAKSLMEYSRISVALKAMLAMTLSNEARQLLADETKVHLKAKLDPATFDTYYPE